MNPEIITSYLFSEFSQFLGKNRASVLLSMTLGSTKLLSLETQQLFKVTGMSHVLVASGSNVGVVLWLANLALKSFKSQNWLTQGLLIWVVIGYWWLVGLDPSITRAAVMAIYSRLARLFNRDYTPLAGLIFSAVVIAAIWPQMLVTISFQFSFLASLGIMLFAGQNSWLASIWNFQYERSVELIHLPTGLGQFLINDLTKKIRVELLASIRTSIAAQALVFPLSWYYFETFSISSIMINIIMITFFNWLSIASWLVVLVAPLSFWRQTHIFLVGLLSLFIPFYDFCLTLLTWLSEHVATSYDSSINLNLVLIWWGVLAVGSISLSRFKPDWRT